MNKVILHGRLTNDIELKNTNSGVEVCNFTVAINRPSKDKANKIADFIPCVAFKESAAFISKYFHKGDGILVDGYLQSRKYTDKQGNERTAYEVVCSRTEFAEKKRDASEAAPAQSSADDEGELPF